MKVWNAVRHFSTSNPGRIGLSVFITAIYAALCFTVFPTLLHEPTTFAVVPIGIAAWLLGVRGGLITSVVVMVIIGITLELAHEPVLGPGMARAVVALAAGLAIGWLRDTETSIRGLATEIQQARHDTLEQRTMSDALRDTLSEMVGTLELSRVFQLILNNVWRVVPHDAANIMLIENEKARIVAWRGYSEADINTVLKNEFDVNKLNNLREMLETRHSIAIPEVNDYPGWVHYQHGRWIHAYVGAPIRIAGNVIGFLNLDSAAQGLFSASDGLRLQTFADEAAIAIQNARLYEQVARHAGQLEKRVAERTHELRAAKERLEELDQLKSKFVADVSHELRTPVANLSLYVDLLQNGPREKHDDYVEVVGQQVARLSALVESILNLTRLELGRDNPDHGPVDLNRLAREAVTAFTPRADGAGLNLVFDPDDRLPPVQGDSSQLGQLIGNLLSNAIQYTRKGMIHLSTRLDPKGGGALLCVTDTGVGISAEDMPHLFERFYRGQNAAESAIPGTGLGLSIVQEIVTLHDGRIEVESMPERGSTFTVNLPLAKAGG